MKTLNFKVSHRVVLSGLIDAEGRSKNNSLSGLSKLMKLSDKVQFSEAEQKDFQLRAVPVPGATDKLSFQWNKNRVIENEDGTKTEGEEVDIVKSFEFSDEEVDLIKQILKHKDEAKEFELSGLSTILDIAKQVGYDVE